MKIKASKLNWLLLFHFFVCGNCNNWNKNFSNSNIKGNLLDFLDKLELFTNSCFLQIFHWHFPENLSTHKIIQSILNVFGVPLINSWMIWNKISSTGWSVFSQFFHWWKEWIEDVMSQLTLSLVFFQLSIQICFASLLI